MAYAGVTQPTATDFGDITARGVAQIQQARQLEDAREERAYKRRLDLEDRYGIPEDMFVMEDTEFRTVNDVTTEAISQARERYYDVFKQLEADPTNVELKKKLARIKGTVATLGKNHEQMLNLGKQYVEMLANDQISGVDEEEMQQILEGYDEGRVRVHFDENDQLQYLFYDKEGKLVEAKKYTELARKNLTRKVDIPAEVSELVKGLGGYKKDTPEGMYIRTNVGYGIDQMNAADQWIDSQMEDDSVMADLLHQATGAKKREGFTDEDREAVRGYLQNEIKARFTTEDTMKADSVKLAQMQEAGRNRRAREAANKKMASIGDFKVAEDPDGGVLMRDNRVIVRGRKGVQVDPSKTEERFDEVRYGADGSLVLHGSDRIKVKGIQDSNGNPITPKSKEDVMKSQTAKDNNWDISLLEESQNDDGTTTFYYNEPQTTKNESDLNKFAISLGLEGVSDLQVAIDSMIATKYGVENLEAFKRGEIKNAPTGEKKNASRFNPQ